MKKYANQKQMHKIWGVLSLSLQILDENRESSMTIPLCTEHSFLEIYLNKMKLEPRKQESSILSWNNIEKKEMREFRGVLSLSLQTRSRR